MRNGKLNKRERDVLLRAEKIVNSLIDWHEENDEDFDLDDFYISMLCNVAGGLDQYLYATRGE